MNLSPSGETFACAIGNSVKLGDSMVKKNTNKPTVIVKVSDKSSVKTSVDAHVNKSGQRSFSTEHIASRISAKPKPSGGGGGSS